MRLSSLRSVIRRILVESKVDDLQAKNPDVDVRVLSAADLSPTKKYLAWMIKQVVAGADEEEVTALVSAFDANALRLPKKDINAYASVSELKAALSALPEKSKSQERRSVKEEGSVKVYEDENQVVVRPDTKKAVQKYGRGKKWCITQEKESHYETYSSNNVVFYFVISRSRPQTDPFSKVAISIQRGLKNEILQTELFDATDKGQSVESVSEHVKGFAQILSVCEQDAVTRPMGSLAKLKNGIATEEEIEKLYVGADKQTKVLIAQNKKTPARLLMILAKDEDEYVTQLVAQNPSAPAELLSALAKNEDVNVRCSVALNPSAPTEVLSILAKDKNVDVRWNVARNTSAPVEVLLNLARDKNVDVRWNVTTNRSAPAEALSALAKDKNVNVRINVAANLSAPAEALSALAKDEDEYVRGYVASNLSTPAEALSALAKDRHEYVRVNVAKNTSAPVEVLSVLAKDEDEYVRDEANRSLAKRKQNEGLIRQYVKLCCRA